MLMTFSKPIYMERIISGVKIHTIRKDPHKRWRVGMKAHMWMHSPRTPSKNPFQFAESEVTRVLPIEIKKKVKIHLTTYTVWVNRKKLNGAQIAELAKADGFDDMWSFLDWFGEFSGRLIYWGDLKLCKNTRAP